MEPLAEEETTRELLISDKNGAAHHQIPMMIKSLFTFQRQLLNYLSMIWILGHHSVQS